jgi:hypothetical protein
VPQGIGDGLDRPGRAAASVIARLGLLSLYPTLREAWKHQASPTIKRGRFMARIIVTTDPRTHYAAPVLLDESVSSIHLDNDHNAAQLIERLGWAITDAENTQRTEQVL